VKCCALGFNPRPRVGGDVCRLRSMHSDSSFQSTPPRGGRREAHSKW